MSTRPERRDEPGPEDYEPAWPFDEGDEIVPGIRAWGPLGEGRRCETWLGWDEERWSPVAVKLPRPERLGCERTLANLRREAEITGRLVHLRVQRLLDERLSDPLPHLVFEYVEGPVLADLVQDEGGLDPGDLTLLAMQLASALRYLHGRGVAHLDVKPDNVVVRSGHSVLIDFAFARPLGEPAPDGPARGTPAYMAPEQCRREPAAASMDLFALGALLYETATGTPAFDSGPDSYAQLGHRSPPVGERVRGLPRPLRSVIDALLEPEPARRPGTAEVLNALPAALPPGTPRLWPEFMDGRA